MWDKKTDLWWNSEVCGARVFTASSNAVPRRLESRTRLSGANELSRAFVSRRLYGVRGVSTLLELRRWYPNPQILYRACFAITSSVLFGIAPLTRETRIPSCFLITSIPGKFEFCEMLTNDHLCVVQVFLLRYLLPFTIYVFLASNYRSNFRFRNARIILIFNFVMK